MTSNEVSFEVPFTIQLDSWKLDSSHHKNTAMNLLQMRSLLPLSSLINFQTLSITGAFASPSSYKSFRFHTAFPIMSSIVSKETSVSDIVTAYPMASKVFEKHHIDFCCGGKESVEKVCQDKKLDVNSLMKDIQDITTSDNEDEIAWEGKTDVDEMIDFILPRYHETLKEDLARLGPIMSKVVKVHGERHPELLEMKTTYDSMSEELLLHMQKEEQILFPFMRRIYAAWTNQAEGGDAPSHPCGSVANPIGQMEREHEAVGRDLATISRLSNEYTPPEDGCNTYRALLAGLKVVETDLHQHIHLENHVLQPLAIRMEQEIQQRN